MLRKLFFAITILLAANYCTFAQSGTLKGKILDKDKKEPIPFANVVIEQGGKQYGGATTDFDGNYTIKPIPPGKYDLRASYVGYKPTLTKGVVINSDKITFFDINLESTAQVLNDVIITDYKVPLISKDQTQSGETVTSDQIKNMPGRSAESVAITVGGVFSRDGNMGSVRGKREDGTVTFIDGIRVRGSSSLPKSAIEQVSVITGGTPAKYGEATGGVLNITTKGPAREFGGSLEAVTSQFLDKYGYNIVGLSLNGPLIKSRKKDDKTSLLGFFISAEGNYVKEPSPSSIGYYKVSDDRLSYIEQHPLRPSGTGYGSYREGEFTYGNQIENIKARENAAAMGLNVTGKLDVKTTKNTNLTFGGTYIYSDRNTGNSLFNKEVGESINSTMRFFGRFTQRFPTETDSKSFIKNVFYQIQVDYTKVHGVTQSASHKDRLFDYGYVGQFKSYRARGYSNPSSIIIDGVKYDNARIFQGWYDTLVSFKRSEVNPILANYTQQYYDQWQGQNFAFFNTTIIRDGKALLNGDLPDNIYSLFSSPGTPYNGYSVGDETQLGINANGSADIGNHAIEFGVQYEQLTDRGFSYSPVSLWTLMRSYTNSHIMQLDLSNPMLSYDEFGRLTVDYNMLYDSKSQTYFDYNLRKKLGLPVNGTDWIDIDNLDPSTFNINMFSADELLRDGNNSVASFYGYDHTGKVLSKQPSLDDFFNAKDSYGNYTRQIGAFQPIYMAGYIQDKFAFKDLIFNVGLRVDRFDANQKVLKDPYLLYEAYNVGSSKVQELVGNMTNGYQIPSNMGSGYTVYVNDYNNPSSIIGYRDGSNWYNASGAIVTDPDNLAAQSGGKIQPYLIDPNNQKPSSSAFKDYEPQTTFMPRISFSFPISEDALFFAHYDVITKRPTSGLRMDPTEYLFWEAKAGNSVFSNPNLKPEKTIDYEIGYNQKLSSTSSLKISTYYSEVRDMVQTYRFSGAYPTSYIAFNNIDFGTVKGLTISYDLRQTGNVSLRASYTLQFANGTGSDAGSGLSLVSSGQPNLRNLIPLDYDRRHAITLAFDYRYGSGKDYNGPRITKKTKDGKVKIINLLENMGLNVTFTGGSGVPFSKSSRIVPLGGSGYILQGSLAGARLPWEFFIDAKIDKDIEFKWSGKTKKPGYLNIYLQVMNVLNTQNVISVYRATGNPGDDGYLAAAEWQTQINQQIDSRSYRDLYSVAVNSPGNYSLPRRIRLGLILGF